MKRDKKPENNLHFHLKETSKRNFPQLLQNNSCQPLVLSGLICFYWAITG